MIFDVTKLSSVVVTTYEDYKNLRDNKPDNDSFTLYIVKYTPRGTDDSFKFFAYYGDRRLGNVVETQGIPSGSDYPLDTLYIKFGSSVEVYYKYLNKFRDPDIVTLEGNYLQDPPKKFSQGYVSLTFSRDNTRVSPTNLSGEVLTTTKEFIKEETKRRMPSWEVWS